jgi:DNA-binding NarL/FixJ family response regulator
MFKVALADDHVLIRQGLAALVNSFANYDVLFEADNGKQLTEEISRGNIPDLVLLDITMPEMDGYAAAAWLKSNYPEIKVIALSVMDDENAIIRMVRNGARGYLLKSSKPADLKQAMDMIINRGYYFNDLVNNKIINSINKFDDEQGSLKKVLHLTDREIEFLKLLCSERTYKEIADEMFVSPRTVDSYRDNLFLKLQIKSRIGLVLFAIKNKIVEI